MTDLSKLTAEELLLRNRPFPESEYRLVLGDVWDEIRRRLECWEAFCASVKHGKRICEWDSGTQSLLVGEYDAALERLEKCEAAEFGSVAEMEQEIADLRRQLAEAQQARERAEKSLSEVDDVLVVNWVGPRKDGDYRMALHNLVTNAIREYNDPHLSPGGWGGIAVQRPVPSTPHRRECARGGGPMSGGIYEGPDGERLYGDGREVEPIGSKPAMTRAEEIALNRIPQTADACLYDPAKLRATFAAALESYAKEEWPIVRKRIADCLKGNAFPETQWGKGYCAGILAALTAFDDAIATRIREGQ